MGRKTKADELEPDWMFASPKAKAVESDSDSEEEQDKVHSCGLGSFWPYSTDVKTPAITKTKSGKNTKYIKNLKQKTFP